MNDDSKKAGSIPEWQKVTDSTDVKPTQEGIPSKDDENALLSVAREWLSDTSIKEKPREDKTEYLKTKGLSAETINTLLNEDQSNTTREPELRTVHDTSERLPTAQPESQPTSSEMISSFASSSQDNSQATEQRPEVAPIITYPEFLLKPQKPPPLITVPRLVNAAYAIAGVAGLTWAASKYIIDPMLTTLTEARREFADTTLQDLQKLNDKLEGTVTHVPYFPSSKRHQNTTDEQEDDSPSLDDDPTELFHRDVATQTTPGLSRSSSTDSLSQKHQKLDPTIAQADKLSTLAYTVRSLVQSIDHSSDNSQYLQKTVADFQKKLDQMESSYSTLGVSDFYGSSSIYSVAAAAANDTKKARDNNGEAQKFKQEIRSLKGAFLSSRNFPTAPRPTAAAGGGSSYGGR